MPDAASTTTPPAMNSGVRSSPEPRRRGWIPIYPVYPKDHIKAGQKISSSLPIDWICPCGQQLLGGKSCRQCGRVPLDKQVAILDGPLYIPHSKNSKGWHQFAKGGRC